MSSLPIDPLKSDFLSRLCLYPLIVEAETGSGKSTRLPLWAAEQGRVLVIEPRRIACTSLAQFLARQKNERLGQSVGYAIKLENCCDQDTEIVFVTPGVALRWFSQNRLSDFKTIIVDEFHERRWDTDLLVALLKRHRQHQWVLTSATIEGEKLARYLDGQRLQAKGRHFEVVIAHRASDSRQLPDARNLERRIREEVRHLLDLEGDILVFLPGRKEISQCQNALADLAGVLVVPLHASISDQQREVALRRQPHKKIVLATNVAETSLTIDNIVAVIDSGLERRTEQRNGKTTLSLKHISKASARQRSGRAGRVMDGVCVRLYGEHAALVQVTPPELHRETLTEAMLASACCGVALDTLEFLDPLPEKSMHQASSMLRTMGAVDANGLATEHGQRLYPLPIDALYADLVTRMPERKLQEAMVDLTSVLATPASLYRLSNDEDALEQLAQQEPWGCDAELAVRLLRGEHFAGVTLDPSVLKEARALSDQMRAAFALPQLSVASRYSRQQWVEAIARLHPELLFVRRETRREALANGEMEVMPGRASRLPERSDAALVLDTHSLPGRGVKQTLNLATVTLPIHWDIFTRLNLGEWVEGKVKTIEDQPHIELNLIYAGRVVATRTEPAQGTLAITPLLQAVKRGELLPGFARQRHQQIEHWNLYQALNRPAGTATPATTTTFDDWFCQQLTMLELTQVDELALFSADDFPFEGVPDWEYQDFADRFPFELYIGDLTLTVEYLVQKKRIHLVYQSGLRKGEPKRWELPKWSGWRIQYKKASRIVDIR
ncbi:helicase-related protein [Vibrio ostreicida]|uniref:Helicase-related protein n=1 Tax=Vibrio ostreicida TaxID=526588 RepID=A0ABT8BV54_9VIBR|nr:helicase-related protein [Vibrio ostreicida]MDN3610259.1 helicase-related protein [Vibrio ostreicida]NPD07725.1 ATP-dependent RNA helicase [Vibrio ostreicida]